MNLRKHLLEAATLVAAAILCALISNALASRERKMALVGAYPNALTVPAQSTAPLPPSPDATATPGIPASVAPASTAPLTMTIAPVAAIAATSTVPVKPASPKTTSTSGTAPDVAPTTSTAPATQKGASAQDVLKRFPVHADKPYVELAYDDVAALHDAQALFLDARRSSVYEQGHVAGARSYSVWESDIDDKVRQLFDERGNAEQQALPIVIYCSGGECEDSHMLAQKLWGIQFNNLYVYRDGFPDWQKRGGAVRTGATP